ncbi:TPA: hypothetical protein ACIDQK_002256 [Shigella flexneri]|nr:hypothetical protein [Shigella flexneri]
MQEVTASDGMLVWAG